MTIPGRQPLDRQRHVASSGHDYAHVDDRLGSEPRNGGDPDVLDANSDIGNNRPGPRAEIVKPPRPSSS